MVLQECEQEIPVSYMERQTLFQKLKGDFIPANVSKYCSYFDLKETNKELAMTIVKQKSPIVCINDSNMKIPYQKVKKELNEAFAKVLPDKSAFELE